MYCSLPIPIPVLFPEREHREPEPKMPARKLIQESIPAKPLRKPPKPQEPIFEPVKRKGILFIVFTIYIS